MFIITWGSPKTKSLFRFTISFKFLMCTATHPICGEIVYWVVEGSISPFKSQYTIGVRWALSGVQGASS